MHLLDYQRRCGKSDDCLHHRSLHHRSIESAFLSLSQTKRYDLSRVNQLSIQVYYREILTVRDHREINN